MSIKLLKGCVMDQIRTLADESVQCVVSSPPYWGLRDYKIPSSIWGGDPACAHEWGDEIAVSRMGNPNGGLGDTGTGEAATRLPGLAERAQRSNSGGQFCACGAWLGTLGLEPDYRLYIAHMVDVFRQVKRVLRKDGTLWLNMGDSYATGTGKERLPTQCGKHGYWENPNIAHRINGESNGLKPKDLCGIPWRLALALQDDGWWLRQDLIWAKPNPMPESVTDRCTKSHEYLFLLAKSERYHYDADAIMEEASASTHARLPGNGKTPDGWDTTKGNGGHGAFHKEGREDGYTGYEHKTRTPLESAIRKMDRARKRMGGGNKSHKGATEYENSASEEHRTKAGLVDYSRKMAEPGSGVKNNASMDAALAIMPLKRNKRSVWTITTQPFSEAHFATFPPDLVIPCILAGTSEKGCCAACGAPLKRATEMTFVQSQAGVRGDGHKPLDASDHRNGFPRGSNSVETTGWARTCTCEAATVPCVVLDPFGGAGTTGLVADRLGRNAILIEINPDYAAMASKRITDDAPLFADVG